MKKAFSYETALGTLGIVESGGMITHILFEGTPLPADSLREETPLIKRTADQLSEFLEGKRRQFDIPIEEEGTDFEKKVWRALRDIPYGQTRTYGQIATAVGNPKASRAVGRANGRNPLPIISPCHRVIGSDGSLTGFAGGVATKKKLLEIEQPDSSLFR